VSVSELVGDLTRETGTLLRQELTLAGTELRGKAAAASKDVAVTFAGALLAHAGAIVVLMGVAVGLAAWLPLWLSAVITGGCVLVVGVGSLAAGLSALRRFDPAPEQTVKTLRENRAWLKEQLR
jgi:cytochrome c biogenesis protein ResB